MTEFQNNAHKILNITGEDLKDIIYFHMRSKYDIIETEELNEFFDSVWFSDQFISKEEYIADRIRTLIDNIGVKGILIPGTLKRDNKVLEYLRDYRIFIYDEVSFTNDDGDRNIVIGLYQLED